MVPAVSSSGIVDAMNGEVGNARKRHGNSDNIGCFDFIASDRT